MTHDKKTVEAFEVKRKKCRIFNHNTFQDCSASQIDQNKKMERHLIDEYQNEDNETMEQNNFSNNEVYDDNMEGFYVSDNNYLQESEGEQTDSLSYFSSVSAAMNELETKSYDIDEHIKALEKEEQYLNAQLDASNKARREEANILKENFAILTHKLERKKIREAMFTSKIMPKKTMVYETLRHIVPSTKTLTKDMLKSRVIHEENEKKTKQSINNAVENQRKYYMNEMKKYDDLIAKSVENIEKMSEWKKEIEENEREIAALKEIEKQEEIDMANIENEIQAVVENAASYDCEKMVQVLEETHILIAREEEQRNKEMKESEKLMSAVNEDIVALHREHDVINSEMSGLEKQIETVVENKKILSNEIQENNLKIQGFHLEKLTVENVIQSELRKLDIISNEIEESQGLLHTAGESVIDIQREIDNFRNHERDLNTNIAELDFKVNELEDKVKNMNLEKNYTILNNAKEQFKMLVEAKNNESRETLVIIEKDYEDIITKFSTMETQCKETEAKLTQEETDMKEYIDKTMISLENLNLDIQNKVFNINCTEQDIAKGKESHASELAVLKSEIEKRDEALANIKSALLKVTNDIKDDIKAVNNDVEIIQIKTSEYEAELKNKTVELEKLKVDAQNYEKNNQDKIIADLETELASMGISKELNGFNQMKEELIRSQNNLDELKKELKNKRDDLYKNEQEFAGTKKEIDMIREHIKIQNEQEELFKNMIQAEEVRFEKKENDLKSQFKEKIQNVNKKVNSMKRSLANKCTMLQTCEIEKFVNKKKDVDDKSEQTRKDIDMLKSKKIELEGKVEKKKGAVRDVNEKMQKIKKILHDHGLEDFSNSLPDNSQSKSHI